MHRSNRLLYAAAVVVPLAVLALAAWLNFRQVRADAFREARQNATTLSEHARRTFHAHELILQLVDTQLEGWSWSRIEHSENVHRLLERLAQSKDTSSVFLLDAKGHTFVSSRRFPMPQFDATDRDYYRALAKRADLYISEPAKGELEHDRFFVVARRRSAPANAFDGLIAVSVNPHYFESFYASFLDPSQAASLVRADGVVLARHPGINPDVKRLPEDSAFMRAVAASPGGGAYVTRSLTDGIERVIAYQRVADYPVYASFQLSMDSVWSAWLRATLPYAFASLLAMGLTIAMVALAGQRARRAAAEEASRAKDHFLAVLSHELRNPLAAVSSATELLDRARLDDIARDALGVIARQVLQLRRLLDDLLDTARAIYGKLKLELRRVDVAAMARVTAADHTARAAGRASIAVEGQDAWVMADPVRLCQMLDNLIDNAVKYGGRRISVRVERDAEAVRVRVEDDGQGIDPALLPRLFEPFVQGEQSLDRAQGGLGLGLALVRRLAVLHGGSLEAASAGPGKGSCFTLRLPATEPPVGLAESGAARAGERWRLLVVDDEPDARETLRMLLEFEGHEVAVAADGAEGLARLAAFRPDAALVDIGLPGMDGYEFVRRARRIADVGAVIAVTGYGQAEDRKKALAAGFDAHLTKPISYEDLQQVLARVLAERATRRAAG